MQQSVKDKERKGANNPPDTKVSKEGRVGGAPGTRVEVPLQPMEDTTVKQAFPAVHGEDHARPDIHTVLPQELIDCK